MSIDARDAISGHAEVNAKARAMAIEIGAKWKCSRVRQWVGLDDCIARHSEARASGEYAPCLECASILRSLREMGCVTPVNIKAPEAKEPALEPKKITIIKETPMPPKITRASKPKTTTATSKPAKKGTPDPIAEEVKAVVEPKEENLSEPATEVKEEAASLINPFDGWTKYDPMASRRAAALEFAAISRTSISFSAAATERLRLKSFPSVTLYYQKGRIGIELVADGSGVLKCTNETKGRAGVKVAAQGLVKALGLDTKKMKGKRYALREVGPGLLEIDLGKEIAA